MKAVAFRAVGRVQGVSYRAFTRRTADRLGVVGWVRNEADGSVVGHAEGDDDAVDALLDALRQGPPGARVDALETAPTEIQGARGFTVR